MPQPRPITYFEPTLLLFRERTPRPTPDGKLSRTYTFADGSVREAIVDTPDFSAWEAPYLAAPTSGH